MNDDDVDEDDEPEEGSKKEERPHRKKKNRRAELKLDEDDLDLIEENIGMKVNKRKRLQKHSEKERN